MPVHENLTKRPDPFCGEDTAGPAQRDGIADGALALGPAAWQDGQATEAAGAAMSHWADRALAEDAERSPTDDKKGKKGDADPAPHAGKDAAKKAGSAKVVEIGGEKVHVASDDEAKKAEALIKRIKELYGVEVSSQKGVDALKAKYTKVPAEVTGKIKTKEWAYKELVALDKALGHFAPILGKNRETSSRKGTDQELTSVSKLDQSIDRNSAKGTLDEDTMGEYFGASKNFSAFSAGTDEAQDFKSNAKQLEGTMVHEIAHGLFKYQLDAFVAKFAYWTDQNTQSGKADAEAPPTGYGKNNAKEDLSESVMYYFVAPEKLKSKCPQRYAFIKSVVDGWSASTAPVPDAKPAK
jgi:hypothetical protein